jgi:hypothetical protein
MKNIYLNSYIAFGLMAVVCIVAGWLIIRAINLTNFQYVSAESILNSS